MSFLTLISRKLWARPLSPVICHTCKQKKHALLLWIYAFLHPASERKTQKLLVGLLGISPEERCPGADVVEKGMRLNVYKLPLFSGTFAHSLWIPRDASVELHRTIFLTNASQWGTAGPSFLSSAAEQGGILAVLHLNSKTPTSTADLTVRERLC